MSLYINLKKKIDFQNVISFIFMSAFARLRVEISLSTKSLINSNLICAR